MRTSRAFFSSAFVTAAICLAATAGTAGDRISTNVQTPAPPPPPTSCVAGAFTVSVSRGPLLVNCTATATNPSGQCTEIEYTVSGSNCLPDHVAALEGVGIQYVTGPGNQWYAPGVGDPVTDIGEHSVHEQAAKFNPNSSVQKFTIGVAGIRNPSPTTVATKKGYNVSMCRILGMGLENVTSPFQTTRKFDTKIFKGCAVRFELDPNSPNPEAPTVLSAELDLSASTKPSCSVSDNGPGTCCSELLVNDISALNLSIGQTSLGTPKFGSGYISSGENSCTSYVIGGRVYSWGSPCP